MSDENAQVTVNVNGSEAEQGSSESNRVPSRPLKLEIDEALLDVEDTGEAFPSPSSSLLPPPTGGFSGLESADAEELHLAGAPRHRHFKTKTPLTAKDLKKEAIIGSRESQKQEGQ